MGSQFVDLDADGHLDYLTATFDGSPHVAWGGEAGFGSPEHLLDAQGERIVISHLWDYELESHEVIGRAMGTDSPRTERCISALAYDWDADGDYDLLLGSYENGRLYRQMNEGTKTEPKFTGRNLDVLAGDGPFAIDAKMTAPALVDWDGDGDLDLLAGSFGDAYGHESPGGALYLSLNGGERGKPDFGPLLELVAPSAGGHRDAMRPDAGLYADPIDFDGDGDLDLVVGGYSMWKPVGRELTPDEQQRADELSARLAEIGYELDELMEELMAEVDAATAGLDSKSDAWRKAYREVAERFGDQRRELSSARAELQEELDTLVPANQREPFVWLYERRCTHGAPAEAAAAGQR